MKRILVIALTTFFVISTVAKDVAALAWDIWYVANREYVAENLCVNKQKPKMHCNGKCHLAKQLQRIENAGSPKAPGNKAPVPKNTKYKEISWIASGNTFTVGTAKLPVETTASPAWPSGADLPLTAAGDVFRPPIV